ncbi:MAG: LemA family protein [Mailhella sp.]|nr:LemA family protein [Mailhella sp.]
MIIAGIVLALALVIVVWGIGVYNGLIRLRNMKDEGWSGIDVQLKRRHDLVGNLVNTVKGYMAHEKDVLEEIAKMRSVAQNAAGVAQAAQAEGQLSQALGRLFAVMENYPQLRANENVMQLQNTLTSLEDEIQLARRYYNGTVREYNTRTEVFPASIIARQYGFQKAEFFELDSVAEREVPQVSF